MDYRLIRRLQRTSPVTSDNLSKSTVVVWASRTVTGNNRAFHTALEAISKRRLYDTGTGVVRATSGQRTANRISS